MGESLELQKGGEVKVTSERLGATEPKSNRNNFNKQKRSAPSVLVQGE